MTERLITLLASLLLAFAAVGCGDDGSSDRSGADGQTGAETRDGKGSTSKGGKDAGRDAEADADAQAERPETTSPDEKRVEGGANGGKASEKGDGRQPASPAKECNQRVRGATRVSAESRSRLLDLCEEVGSGDRADVKRAQREVCETIVRETIPEGTPKHDAFLRECRDGDAP